MAKFTKKTLIIGSSLSLAGILVAGLAVAAVKHGKHHHHHGAYMDDKPYIHGKPYMHGKMMKLHKLDTNDDDAISLTEFQQPLKQRFEAQDLNQDGVISADEYLQRANDRFATLDADANGMIGLDELPKRYRHEKGSDS